MMEKGVQHISTLLFSAEMNNKGAVCIRKGSLIESIQYLSSALKISRTCFGGSTRSSGENNTLDNADISTPARSEDASSCDNNYFPDYQYIGTRLNDIPFVDPVVVTKGAIEKGRLLISSENTDLALLVSSTLLAAIVFNLALVYHKRVQQELHHVEVIHKNSNKNITRNEALCKSKALYEKSSVLLSLWSRMDNHAGNQEQGAVEALRAHIANAVFNNLIQILSSSGKEGDNPYTNIKP